MNGISKLLSTDGFITVNKTLIRELGLHEAILIGELCSEYNYWEKCDKLENDMFYSTRDNIEYHTGLNEHYQRKAMVTLKERGILEVKKQGIPAVNYYKLNFDKILTLLSTSSSSREQLDVNSVNLNNNKQTKIKEQKNNSKELLQTPNFSFGKQKTKPKKESLYTKCTSLIYSKTEDKEIQKLLFTWLNMLLEKYKDRGRTLYANVFSGKLNMLDKYDRKDWKEIIEYNLQRGYEGFYPINNYSKSKDKRSDENMVHVPSMTEEDYKREERELAELKKKGVRTTF